jgi:hypothetical protein
MRTIALATAFVAATLLGSAATPTSAQTGSRGAGDLRDRRYCEILLGYIYAAKINAPIFNTIGYNDCPQDKMSSLDLNGVKKENAADVAFLNGPRHWVMDAINGLDVSGSGETKNFGGIEMTKVGTTQVPLGALKGGLTPTPYTTMAVSRTTIWIYDAHKAVFELTDPGGGVYIMQSYSQQVDPNLKMSDLPSLGSRLKLPAGWTYKTEILQQELELNSNGLATITHDDLQDTYQKR